jgi:glycosyltransferase involved in cell wall biosynthesis
MKSEALPEYRFLSRIAAGVRVLDLSGVTSLGAELLAEAGNRVDLATAEPGGAYRLIVDLHDFGTRESIQATLNRLRFELAPDGVFVVSAWLSPETQLDPQDSGRLFFRFESLAKLLQERFRVVSHAFVHGDVLRAEWNQYSPRVVFFCRYLNPGLLAEGTNLPATLDELYGGAMPGFVPQSLDCVRAWLKPPPPPRDGPPHGNLLFFLQPLPLYDYPLIYQRFLERYYLLGEAYRELGWNSWYATTAPLKTLYGLVNALAPEDFGHPPPLADWRRVYAKTLDPCVPLDDPDIEFWSGYVRAVLDRVQPAAIFVWNSNAVLDRIAEGRGIPVIHNEVALDRPPRPSTYFFDPRGVNAESSLASVWKRFEGIQLPECCLDLVRTHRRSFQEPWLGPVSRVELLHSLGLDPQRRTILLPLQVENDSNVLLHSPFASMSEFCQTILSEIREGAWNILIKPHPASPAPASVALPSRPNIRLLDSSYAMGSLIRASDVVCTINSTAGYEALTAGKPVLVFGSAPYAGLGFTADVKNPPDFRRSLEEARPACPCDIEKFTFVASMFYPVTEDVMSIALLQEPYLHKAIEWKHQGADAASFWPDPARVDWERFCSERKTSWLDGGGRTTVSYGFPQQPAVEPRPAASEEALESRKETIALGNRAADLSKGLKVVETANALLRNALDQERRELEARDSELTSLRAELAAKQLPPQPGPPPPDRSSFRRGLHRLLDISQTLTPETLRRAVRPFYLNRVYYRIYPENRPPALIERVRPDLPRHSPESLGSKYAPFVEFKQLIHFGLPLKYPSLACHDTPNLVSVVLPVHNGEHFIAESIESVLSQTYSNFELVIVNDGSTDGTLSIIARYETDPRLRVLHQPNRKLPAALNTGFSHCRGEFRTWTSADNIMLPDMLETLVSFLRRRPDVQAVFADQDIMDDSGQPLLRSDFCPGYQTPPGSAFICWPEDPGELSFIHNNSVGACFLYRAWAARLVGDYSEDSFGYEDYEFWMRMNDLFRLAHLDERKALYRYRLHARSLSAREKELRIVERAMRFMTYAGARRSFFAQPFDISFFGTHSHFVEMAQAYRQAGHNVFEAPVFDEDRQYLFRVTRAYEKSIAFFGEHWEARALEAARQHHSIIVQVAARPSISPDLCWSVGDAPAEPGVFSAATVDEILYPILAGANTLAHARKYEHPEAAEPVA